VFRIKVHGSLTEAQKLDKGKEKVARCKILSQRPREGGPIIDLVEIGTHIGGGTGVLEGRELGLLCGVGNGGFGTGENT